MIFSPQGVEIVGHFKNEPHPFPNSHPSFQKVPMKKMVLLQQTAKVLLILVLGGMASVGAAREGLSMLQETPTQRATFSMY